MLCPRAADPEGQKEGEARRPVQPQSKELLAVVVLLLTVKGYELPKVRRRDRNGAPLPADTGEKQWSCMRGWCCMFGDAVNEDLGCYLWRKGQNWIDDTVQFGLHASSLCGKSVDEGSELGEADSSLSRCKWRFARNCRHIGSFKDFCEAEKSEL
jgi:hypothetical protein